MPNAVSYLRISTESQGSDGLGVDAQRAAVAKFARGTYILAGEFVDEASGAAPLDKRPGLMAALAALKDNMVLIVAKRDRLSRDPIVTAWIEKECKRHKCRVLSAAGEGTVDDSPTSVLMRRIIDSFAEFERACIKGRTVAALAAKRARGEKTGGRHCPYGYSVADDGKTLVENPVEQKMIAHVKRWRQEGYSWQTCCNSLTRYGFKPRSGSRWWIRVVRKLAGESTAAKEPAEPQAIPG